MESGFSKHRGPRHAGPAHSSPYPVSRLAPAIELVDLAREIAEADQLVNLRLNAELAVIADQIQALQQEARRLLSRARRDLELHHARCQFPRLPGKTYHLYRMADGATCLSMLSPADWRGKPPHDFLGSFRLEADHSWSRVDQADTPAGRNPARPGKEDDSAAGPKRP